MMIGAKLSNLTVSDDTSLKTYHDCIAQVICNPALPTCYLDTCKACPAIDTLKAYRTAVLEDNMIDNVTYRQWVTVDRSSLETVSKTSDEFIDAICEKLKVLIPHSFIATQQASFYKERKSSLKPGELLVIADF